MLMIVWLLAAGYLLVSTLIRQRRFHRRVLAMSPIDPATLKIDLPELCRRSGVTKNIRFVDSDLLDSPAAWGILRPTIILPREMSRSLSAEELHWVLLHELAHVRRRDLAMAAVQRCAAVLYFFHPVVWIANRVIDRLREDACDDLAVADSGNLGVEPAGVFLRVLRFANRGRAVNGALGIFGLGSRAACFRRVRRLLHANRPMRTRRRQRENGTNRLGALVLASQSALHRGKPGGGGAEQIRYGSSTRYRIKMGHFAQASQALLASK